VSACRLGNDDPLPISLVAHHVFCPRRAWLEAMGESTDTYQMAVGLQQHQASDDPTASRPGRLRAVDVASVELGVMGRCDTVEIDDAGAATVVEYKATPVRRRPEVTEPMVVQLALQAQSLRESGYQVRGAAVYFTHHQVRVPVQIGQAELENARLHVEQTASVLASEHAPKPLEDDPRCTRCSHAGVCLPDERDLGPVHRRVLVADPDTQVLHLTIPGSRAFIRSGRIKIEKAREEIGSVPVERVLALVLHGNIDLSSALIRELLWRKVPVLWCSGTGRLIGWAISAASANGGPRVRQHALSESGHLGLAREFVTAKICNQATLLRRHGSAPEAVSALRELQARARQALSLPELLGVEGDAAARYFSAFETMLSTAVREQQGLKFLTRTRRPARDPVNAALNFCYGLLLADVTRAIAATGLDPHAGFLHSSGRNKPALALDLCEELRSPVADAVVIAAFNNGEIKAADFSSVTGSTRLRDDGRAALIRAYERRVMTEFRHPLFGYQVTWRRAMEIQARLVLGVIDGTQSSYKGIATR
jgi:CRISPR-associated protein Cas1